MAGSKQNQYAVWFPTDGPGSAMDIFKPIGRSEITENYAQRSVVFVNGSDGQPLAFGTEEEPPGDLPATTFTFFQESQIKWLEQQAIGRKQFHGQVRLVDCGSIDNPTAWNRLWHLAQCKASTRNIGEGPTARFGGALVESTIEVGAMAVVDIARLNIGALTTTETEDINAVDMLRDNSIGCASGYPGPDKVIFAATNAAAGVTANVLASVNGASFFNITADPFAADENISCLKMRPLGDGFRVVVARGTADAANPPEIGYITATAFDQTTIAALAWTLVNVGSTNNETITAMLWDELNRLYVAVSGGDIYLSTNMGQTFTSIHDGAVAVSEFTRDKDGNVWAVGAANLIMKESVTNRGTFVTKNGPSGGGAFHSIAVANDGIIVAGNGASIFRNNNGALTAGAWTTEVALGANKVASRVFFEGHMVLEGGESELIRAVVDDTTGSAGKMIESVDGGNSWQDITTPTNTGLNDAVQSKTGNKYFIVGDDASILLAQ